MKKHILYLFALMFLVSCGDGIPREELDNAWWLHEADLSAMELDWAEPDVGYSIAPDRINDRIK